MARPKILLVVPLLAAGIYLPPATADLNPLPAGAIGMGHEGYSKKVIKIRTGATITFENNSRWIHVIGPGNDGVLATAESATADSGSLFNMAIKPRVMLQENEIYTTARWNTPGNYKITCTVHPDMNATVIVTA